MSIAAVPDENEKSNSMRVQFWHGATNRMANASIGIFSLEERMLYHFTTDLHRIDIPGVDIKWHGILFKGWQSIGNSFCRFGNDITA